MKPSKPKTPESAKQLQARQINDLAELDEEENTRIKNLFIRRSGARAFRGSAAGRASNASAGGGSGRGGSVGGGVGFKRGASHL